MHLQDEAMPFKASALRDPAAMAATMGPAATATGAADEADAGVAKAVAGPSKAKGKGTKAPAASSLPAWVPDPKILTRRIKSLTTSIKTLLAKPASMRAGGAAGKEAKESGTKANAAKPATVAEPASGQVPQGKALDLSAGAGYGHPGQYQIAPGAGSSGLVQSRAAMVPAPNPSAAAALQQMIQRFGTGPALMQALQTATANGQPQIAAEFLRQVQVANPSAIALSPGAPGIGSLNVGAAALQQQQQQQQQQLLLLQQQAGVLGKRNASAAGLDHSGSSGQVLAGELGASANVGNMRPVMGAGGATFPEPELVGIKQPTGAVVEGGGAVPESASGAGGAAITSSSSSAALGPDDLLLLKQLPLVRRDTAGNPQLPMIINQQLLLLALGR
jgi:hypothetical protein